MQSGWDGQRVYLLHRRTLARTSELATAQGWVGPRRRGANTRGACGPTEPPLFKVGSAEDSRGGPLPARVGGVLLLADEEGHPPPHATVHSCTVGHIPSAGRGAPTPCLLTPPPAVQASVRQGERMKRSAVLIPIVVVAVLLAKRLGPRIDFASRIAAMPDSAPPKWIFDNVTAIRANTDRVPDLLQQQATAEPDIPPGRAGGLSVADAAAPAGRTPPGALMFGRRGRLTSRFDPGSEYPGCFKKG